MKKRLHKGIAFFLLLVLVVAVLPKSYIHELSGHIHHVIQQQPDQDAVNPDTDTKDCSFNAFDTPVHYTVFHFILNFLPYTTPHELSDHGPVSPTVKTDSGLVELRGPPQA